MVIGDRQAGREGVEFYGTAPWVEDVHASTQLILNGLHLVDALFHLALELQ